MVKNAYLQDSIDADAVQLPANPHVEVKLRRAILSVVTKDRLFVMESYISLDPARRQRIVLHPRIDGQLLQLVDSRSRGEHYITHATNKTEPLAHLGRRELRLAAGKCQQLTGERAVIEGCCVTLGTSSDCPCRIRVPRRIVGDPLQRRTVRRHIVD